MVGWLILLPRRDRHVTWTVTPPHHLCVKYLLLTN